VTEKYPAIGFDSASQHFINNLLPAYDRFQTRQTRGTALAVAQAAWQLHERLWHDKGKPKTLDDFRADLYGSCPELELLRDWVEAAKHSGFGRSSVKLVSITGYENPGGTLVVNDGPVTPSGPFRASRTSVPTSTLKLNFNDGRSYDVKEVLKRVVEFWRQELTTSGKTDSVTV
jgi:hypothetical protein